MLPRLAGLFYSVDSLFPRKCFQHRLDHLKSVFPTHTPKDLEKALREAQGDFDVALTLIVSENEAAEVTNQTQAGSRQEPEGGPG